MKILDPTHPFFRPLGVRLAITVFCLGWAVFEAVAASPFWAVIFAAMGLFCAYEFFFNTNNNFAPEPDSKSQTDTEDQP